MFVFNAGGGGVGGDNLKLIILTNQNEGQEIIIKKGENRIIGRRKKDDQNEITPNKISFVNEDKILSSCHCNIISEGDKFYIEDNDSLNGTWRKLDKKEKIRLDRAYRIGNAVKINIGLSQIIKDSNDSKNSLEERIFRFYDENISKLKK